MSYRYLDDDPDGSTWFVSDFPKDRTPETARALARELFSWAEAHDPMPRSSYEGVADRVDPADEPAMVERRSDLVNIGVQVPAEHAVTAVVVVVAAEPLDPTADTGQTYITNWDGTDDAHAYGLCEVLRHSIRKRIEARYAEGSE